MSVPTFKDIPQDINALIAGHIKQYFTDPEAAHMWDATPLGLPGLVPTLLLSVAGRKSGTVRHLPLLYAADEGGFLVIGSKGGNADHPDWFLNLMAAQDCEIRVGTLHARATARVLEGDERAAAWEKVTAQFPVYAKYQARTPREIPVVRLSVAGPA